MSEVFAKLFDTPHGQFLAYLDDTDDEEPAIRIIGAYVRGVRPAAVLSGWEDGEEGQLRAFAKFSQEQANDTAKELFNTANALAPA